MIRAITLTALLVAGSAGAQEPAGAAGAEEGKTQEQYNAELDFMVGEWTTEHLVPGQDGDTTTVLGQASIQRAVGGTFVAHDWTATMEGRGEIAMLLMLNYSPAKAMFNCTMFDRFGGEPGLFHGDWTDENTLVFKASFTEEDGSVSHQRLTFVKLDVDSFTLARAFSDDGELYHFEVTGTYVRK